MAIEASGHILVLHRGAHPVLEFDFAGKFLRSWGDGCHRGGQCLACAVLDDLQLGNRTQQLATMSQQDAELLQILIR